MQEDKEVARGKAGLAGKLEPAVASDSTQASGAAQVATRALEAKVVDPVAQAAENSLPFSVENSERMRIEAK